MSTESIKPTAEKIIALYKSIGKTEKQLDSLAFEISETPLSGYVHHLIEEPQVYKTASGEQQYFVYSITASADSDVEIGTLSVNRAFDSEVKKGDFLVVANEKSENKGKAMLRSHRLTNTNHLGKSRAEQIANLVGCTYTAERVTGNVVKEYTAKMFCPAPVVDKVATPTPANLEKLWSNTLVNEKLMKFNTIVAS